MSAFSDYLEEELLDHVLNDNQWTLPTADKVWVGLSTQTGGFGDDGTGTEVSGGSYARVATDSSVSDKWSGSGGQWDNVLAITFPQATASWGTVRGVGIFDASAAGNLLLHGTLTTNRTVNTNDTFEFAAGDLDISFS